MRRFFLAILTVCLLGSTLSAQNKRDFRGAWIQTIFQGYDKRNTAGNKAYLIGLLDSLQAAGINAVFFQVRPRADALYKSDIEPWSQFLTGAVGREPETMWDPLEFMIEECHKRGMELHAWMNPYRAEPVLEAKKLPKDHIQNTRPELFVAYGKGQYFNPALQECRDIICEVVADVVTRYDVDGIHFDDYFYPYPEAGISYPDNKEYAASGTKLSRGDWRRENVDKLIKQVSETVKSIKPGVRFGISPFCVWRNAKTDPKGSKTSALQGYDALYADSPKWAREGWIDYQIPQLYLSMDHKRAPYRVLSHWWADNGFGRHVYIGQDAEDIRRKGEFNSKMKMLEPYLNDKIQGNCWWYAASIGNVSKNLSNGPYRYKALVPEYGWKEVPAASRPSKVKVKGHEITWKPDENASKWVVYRFDSKNDIDIENPAAIEEITWWPEFEAKRSGVYVITALDQANGESAPSEPVTLNF